MQFVQHAMVPVYSECMGQSHIYVSEKTTQATGLENMIATLIEWKYGGMNVCVEGSWDDWTSRYNMYLVILQKTLFAALLKGSFDI